MTGTGAKPTTSVLALVASNTLPLLGVLFFDWDVGAIVVLFWSENLILGAYNIARMIIVGRLAGIAQSLFFLVHYGGFCAVHGLFVQTLLLDAPIAMGNQSWFFPFVFVELLLDVCAQTLALALAPTTILLLVLVLLKTALDIVLHRASHRGGDAA